MKNSAISIVYFIIGLISLILLNQTVFLPGFISKAFIIPILFILFLVNLNPGKNRLHSLMLAGLFFSWAGDIVLEFANNNGNMFLPGLICFLLAHILYFTVFLLTPGKNSILTNKIWLLIPVIIYGLVLIVYLYADLAAMRLPVIIYAAVILTMLSGAINRLEKVNRKSYYLVLAGAILFVISDSSIAVNKFSHQFESSGIVIMSTYIVAQYLIVAGYISQFRASGTDQITR
jgi:uncharacterized membrane protein YhhN